MNQLVFRQLRSELVGRNAVGASHTMRLDHLTDRVLHDRLTTRHERSHGGSHGLRRVDPSGSSPWLDVKLPESVTKLPMYLLVDYLGRKGPSKNRRDHFRVKEGHFSGHHGSVKARSKRSNYLSKRLNAHSGSHVEFQYNKKTGKDGFKHGTVFIDQYKVNAITSGDNPTLPGKYDLMIPDEAHTVNGGGYGKFGAVWFKVGHGGDRYLHRGSNSLGCITVACSESTWNSVASHLMGSRKGKGVAGTIKVRSFSKR